jgi:AraC-like DNA-binding protein
MDECQTWKDKAAALASYAKQSGDETLHRYADRIKARAIRRGGELTKQIEPGNTARDKKRRVGDGPPLSRKAAAETAGISPRQLKTMIRVANVPAEDFERQIESDAPPTITALAARGLRRF